MKFKLFGVFSGIGSGLLITIVSFVFRVNIIYNESIGQIPIYLWLILVIGFLLFTFFGKNISRKVFNWIYLGVVIVSFIYLFSMLQWSVECCPENYESMYDWDASKSLTWIIHLPIVFGIMIILGLLFDFLRENNLQGK